MGCAGAQQSREPEDQLRRQSSRNYSTMKRDFLLLKHIDRYDTIINIIRELRKSQPLQVQKRENEKAKVQFMGEWTYRGQFRDGKMQNEGQLTCLRGVEYRGNFLDGLPHGKGELVIKSPLDKDKRQILEGMFEDGHFTGKGRVDYGDCYIYQGDFKQGKRQGFGTYKNHKLSIVAKSEWKSDLMQGKGKISQPFTYCFRGTFNLNTREDYGSQTIFKQTMISYRGFYKNGKAQGFGVERSESDKSLIVYVGMWKNNLYDGLGILEENGQRKKGEWKEGQFLREEEIEWEKDLDALKECPSAFGGNQPIETEMSQVTELGQQMQKIENFLRIIAISL